jgi:nucleotide-binding universal stress UspA family protein
MSKTVLVPLDGSPLAERALPYAIALAKVLDGRLLLLHARPALAPRQEPAFDPSAVADRVRAEGVEAEAQVYPIYGDERIHAICETVRERQADLVAMSTHGRGGLGRWLYGSVADAVLRQAEVPVLLVSSACERPWPADRAPRILVPLDGSELAEQALDPVRTLAAELRARLLLLRVVERPRRAATAAGQAAATSDPDLDAARGYLERVATRLGTTAQDVEVQVVDGGPAAMIATIAREQDIDLIAMATHGRGGLARLTLGSVATGTLHRADVPLLIVRPAALRQPPA